MHSVVFDDTDANWLAWGRLVDYWVDNRHNRPHNIGELEDQMTSATYGIAGVKLVGVPAPVPVPNRNRPVNVDTYNNGPPGPIVIPVPTQRMREDDRDTLRALGSHTYPLPHFYTTIFGSAPTRVFTTAELIEMAQCRLGEYVINECM